MKLSHSITLLLSVLTVSGSELCERHEVIQGCRVDNGHALCEAWDMAASIHGLPTCTTRITFSLLADPQHIHTTQFKSIELRNINFGRLTRLQELLISTNYEDYCHVRIIPNSPTVMEMMPNITVLSLKAMMDWENMTATNEGMYKGMKHLQVLDFTRAQRMGLSLASHVLGQQPSMNTLILRNIQEIGHAETYNPLVDLTLFVCGGNVMSLDLSYNDIAYINISNGCWNTKIRYINLNHNILATSIQIREFLWFGLAPISAGLETVKASSICPGDKYQDGLWEDEYDILEYHDSGDIKLSPLSKLFLHSPFSSFAMYDFWLKDVLQHCGNFRIIGVTQCIVRGPKDICDLIEQCMSPDKDLPPCPRNMPRLQPGYFAEHMCSYKQCAYNIPIAIPPQLKSISLQNLGTFHPFNTKILTSDTNVTLCIHPNNNLEVIDVPNINIASWQVVSGFYHLSGLRKLKYLNIQGHKLPLLLSQAVLHDTDSLVELHIGGSKISENDVLPASQLQNLIQLSVLNLSNANLYGIEANAFLNHQHLCVLDLSYNHFNSSSLTSVDLSQTSMKSLNLSHNHLTSIPASMRHQLDKMRGLELYLSGNTFICNCENLEFLQWIQQSSSSITFHYAGDHVCADSPGNTIHNIAIDSLYCDWYWKQPVIAVGSSFALSLFFAMVFGTYKKRWFISNLIFRFQERFCMASENSAGPFKYDAFIVYSSMDEGRLWVHYKLVDKLEKDYGFRLCVEQRDFPGGIDTLVNIERAVFSSRKVLVVLSENLLQGPLCIDSIQMTLNADHNKIIVIMYKDVLLSRSGVPSAVQQILENKASISWTEEPAPAQKLFWKKLTRALYRKRGTADETHTGEWSHEQSMLI